MCTHKRTTHVPKKAFLTAHVSSILSCQVPVKYKDPGCPTISCIIGDTLIEKALLDLGASVNLLPFSVYQTLGLGELKKTSVTLQLADRSVKVPKGIVEDVLIKVGDFVFPVDFIILETQPVVNPNGQIPVILGRPFLATSNALINCRNGLMKLTFGNMTIDLNVFNVGEPPSDFLDQPIKVNMIQELSMTQEIIENRLLIEKDPIDFFLNHLDQNWNESEYLDKVNELLRSTTNKSTKLEHVFEPILPSFEHVNESFLEVNLKHNYDENSDYFQFPRPPENNEKFTLTYPFVTFIFSHIIFRIYKICRYVHLFSFSPHLLAEQMPRIQGTILSYLCSLFFICIH